MKLRRLQKLYSVSSKLKASVEYVKKNPTLPLSTAMLAISSANLRVNSKGRGTEGDQLVAVKELTKELKENNKLLKGRNKEVRRSSTDSRFNFWPSRGNN